MEDNGKNNSLRSYSETGCRGMRPPMRLTSQPARHIPGMESVAPPLFIAGVGRISGSADYAPSSAD